MNGQWNPRKNDRVVFRRLAEGEGGVVLHVESGQYHGLNEVGCMIWELIDGRRTAADIAGDVARLEGAPANAREEVEMFLDGMRARDLIVAEEPG